MANVRITDLSGIAVVTSTDVLPIVDVGGDTTYKITVQNLANNLTQVSSSISASYAVTSSFARTGSYAVTSSYSVTSSFARTGSYAVTSSYAVTASYAVTSSYAVTASYATTGSHAVTSSYALNGGVTSIIAGTGISIDTSTGNVTVTSTGGGGGSVSTNGNTLYSTNPAAGSGGSTVYSIFLGLDSGNGATNSQLSNFIGYQAGTTAPYAPNSNFIGVTAGQNATSASNSNFSGYRAGNGASFAQYSNFIGYQAGYLAQLANTSNFIGQAAGQSAISASKSNFIGYQAGASATSASYSNLIGFNAGFNAGDRGIKSNNIIIGTNITLDQDRQDSINFGGLIFGTGSYSTTTGNPSSGSANGRIGINQPLPIYSLDVSGSGRYTSGLVITGSLSVTGSSSALRLFGSASIVSGALAVGNITPSSTVGRIDASNDIVAYSTSDINYKTNIKKITNASEKVNQISGVEFDWIPAPQIHGNEGNDVGVIAQEIEKVLPQVVTTRDTGIKAVKYEKIVPLLIEAIKDLQNQIDELKQAIRK